MKNHSKTDRNILGMSVNLGVFFFLGMSSVMWYIDNSATSIASPTQASLLFDTLEESNVSKNVQCMLPLLVLCYYMTVKVLRAS